MIDKLRDWYENLPNKKGHVEFVTAILTIPVLLTVIFTNVSNINRKEEPNQKQMVTVVPVEIKAKEPDTSGSPTIKECKKEVGPVAITFPTENDTVTDDPFSIEIDYQVGEFCAVAWQYRLNGTSWSAFTDKDISIYNLTPGKKKLEVRVKSIASNDQELLERNFVYKSETTPTPSASSSATTD